MASNPKLTDDEVCKKYGITRDDPNFATARLLADNRIDRVICQVPDCQCPHCGHEFTANYIDLGDGDPSNGIEVPCEACERSMYIEHLDGPDDDEFDPDRIMVTLTTDDPNGDDE